MNESDIDKIAQKIFALIKKHNSDKSNIAVKINDNFKFGDGNFMFQITWNVWNEGREDTFSSTAFILKNDLDVAELTLPEKTIRIKTEDLPKKIEQALAEIPKN